MRNLFVLFALLVLTWSSCKKYPEGPSLSFRSRTERIINSWAIDQVLVNTSESTPFYSKYMFTFGSDGTFTENDTYKVQTGKWMLTSNEDSILVELPNKSYLHRYKILKLKNNSLWLSENRNTSVYEWHLK